MVTLAKTNRRSSQVDQYTQAQSVDISSTNHQFASPMALFIGSAGNVAVLTEGGDEVTFNGLQDGQILPVWCAGVKKVGTTASSIIGLN